MNANSTQFYKSELNMKNSGINIKQFNLNSIFYRIWFRHNFSTKSFCPWGPSIFYQFCHRPVAPEWILSKMSSNFNSFDQLKTFDHSIRFEKTLQFWPITYGRHKLFKIWSPSSWLRRAVFWQNCSPSGSFTFESSTLNHALHPVHIDDCHVDDNFRMLATKLRSWQHLLVASPKTVTDIDVGRRNS